MANEFVPDSLHHLRVCFRCSDVVLSLQRGVSPVPGSQFSWLQKHNSPIVAEMMSGLVVLDTLSKQSNDIIITSNTFTLFILACVDIVRNIIKENKTLIFISVLTQIVILETKYFIFYITWLCSCSLCHVR